MLTQCAPTVEAPAGYDLLQKLGAGGFGEVWKATAPGGVEKAVKFVFGHCEEEFAERELKALERIRSVRHPFLLSTERYEVVNHRLVIVSELAEMSLDARFKQAQAEGLAGIPRAELLRYLSDAAEALDWLAERHGLQHLDIKPENLLIVGDHLKVADFGLVKSVASSTQNSLVGGMTPAYSAPEIYDDQPSPRSDQYSLAIVFQQMLTGSLPFPGRTPAQLAKQHMQSRPMLSALCEEDRSALARALSKSPADRFARCSDLVAALSRGAATAAEPKAPCAGVTPTPGSEETQAKACTLTKRPGPEQDPLAEACVLTGAPQRRAAFQYPKFSDEVVDLAPPEGLARPSTSPHPTLFIAIGSVGITMMARTRAAIERDHAQNYPSEWLAIDTDPETLKALRAGEAGVTFSGDEALPIPLRRPKQYREESQELLKWLSRRWLYNIPRSLQTRGYRPLGRLALVDHAESVLGAIAAKLAALVDQSDPPAAQRRETRVVILCGASGGAGGGCAIDLGQAAKSVAQTLNTSVRVEVTLACTFSPGNPDSLSAANMYSLLTEFAHAQQHGNAGHSPGRGAAVCFESRNRPFDSAWLVTMPGRSNAAAREDALDSVARYQSLKTLADLGPLEQWVQHECGANEAGACLSSYACVDSSATGGNAQRAARLSCGPGEWVQPPLACGGTRLRVTYDPASGEIGPLPQGTTGSPTATGTLLEIRSGMQPIHLAARLANSFPGIEEAAGRLHSRTDIAWRPLSEYA